eukprot:scaffold1455_cov65-Phaeocystis_antarctica.AAC.14
MATAAKGTSKAASEAKRETTVSRVGPRAESFGRASGQNVRPTEAYAAATLAHPAGSLAISRACALLKPSRSSRTIGMPRFDGRMKKPAGLPCLMRAMSLVPGRTLTSSPVWSCPPRTISQLTPAVSQRASIRLGQWFMRSLYMHGTQLRCTKTTHSLPRATSQPTASMSCEAVRPRTTTLRRRLPRCKPQPAAASDSSADEALMRVSWRPGSAITE